MCRGVKQKVLKAENEGKGKDSLTSAFSHVTEKVNVSCTVSTINVADEGGREL